MYPTNHLSLLSIILLLIPTISSAAIATTQPLLLRQTAASPTFTSDAEFKRAMLLGHNWYRSQHNASNLVWSDQRAAVSSAHSKTCVFQHSGTKGVGENIAYGFPDVAGVVNAWGNERVKYDFARPGYSSAVGHFTAMVWKGTTAIGCGRTRCTNGMNWYVVCQYTPPGNMIGPGPNGKTEYFVKNVGTQIRGKPEDK